MKKTVDLWYNLWYILITLKQKDIKNEKINRKEISRVIKKQ